MEIRDNEFIFIDAGDLWDEIELSLRGRKKLEQER